METRALLAFVLSLMVLFGYQYLVVSGSKKNKEIPAQQKKESQDANQESFTEKKADLGVPETVVPKIEPLLEQADLVPEEYVVVETELARYRISTRNAAIKEVVLKKYKDEFEKPIQLVDQGDFFPLQVISEEKKLELSFVPSEKNIRVDEGRDKQQLVMRFTHPSGASIEKIFTFERDSYAVKVEVRQNVWASYQLLAGALFLKTGEKNEDRYAHVGPVIDIAGKTERIDFKEIKEELAFSGSIPWVAFEGKYFMTALIPEELNTSAVTQRIPHDQGSSILLGIQGNKESESYVFFAGPKDYELLKSFGAGLERVIDFGMFWFLAKPMFYALKFTYNFVGNYGLAIILLTTFIKIIFIPLTHKQQKSMKDMQKVQPEMNAIREKFKGDQQRMSKEMMELYKKYKINPAAGCLPLVIQIPVFFALYNVLLRSIELRSAPFLYIHDLSAADTLFGQVFGFSVGPLPLLMGVSMYVQQKMMPTTMDPKQAKIFQWLPVIFTFMFLNFPSGLVLYWLVNNLLTIIQQLYIDNTKKVLSF